MSSILYSCCSSAYIFTKKRTPTEEKINNYAKILITPILYRGASLEAYLEPSRRSAMEHFCQRLKAVNNFAKTLHPRCLTGS